MKNLLKEIHKGQVIMAKTNWKYHHIGIPTDESITGEKYLKDYKLFHYGFEEKE